MESLASERMAGVAPLVDAGTTAERATLRALQLGALAVVLVAVTDRAFELDRFFVPKELTLHLTALIAGLLSAAMFRRVALTWVDLLLAGYLVLTLLSSLAADDGPAAARAATISASGVVVFWVARSLRGAGLARPLIRALALAVVVGSAMALVQAYGVRSDFFSVNRAPGGTMGNRNFVAHMAAFGLPLVIFASLRAWRTAGYVLGGLGVPVVLATLVLTRSRAGWLAFAAVVIIILGGMLLSRALRRDRLTWARLAGILLLMGLGLAAALLVPNSLRWRSDNPYLDSVTGIANYQDGSGRGRLVQYNRSLRMALDRPLLGVGPGNWSAVYPDYAAPGDPSLSRANPGRTANPWPSSDWVAFFSERGFPAAALLALALLGLMASALRRLLGARDEEEGMAALALLAILAGTVVAGLFDAVLLLAVPTLLMWAAVGALWSPRVEPERPVAARLQAPLMVALALTALLGAYLSLMRLAEMNLGL
jgi:O-antigen ligase